MHCVGLNAIPDGSHSAAETHHYHEIDVYHYAEIRLSGSTGIRNRDTESSTTTTTAAAAYEVPSSQKPKVSKPYIVYNDS